MGKTNNISEVEIIPIPDIGDTPPTSSRRSVIMPYMSDPTIVPRVQKYLETNVDKTYVDINLMADELQRQFPRDYAKRKRSAFRASVKKAYGIVLQSYGIEDQDRGRNDSSDEDLNSDSGDGDDRSNFRQNSMNNQLMDLYTRQGGRKVDENELIDISSDDSNEPGPMGGHFMDPKSSNGPSTSNRDVENYAMLTQYDALQRAAVAAKSERQAEKQAAEKTNDRGRKRKNEFTPSLSNANKRKKSLATLQEPSVTFKDIGGLDNVLMDVCKLLTHVKHPEVYRQIGINPPRGFLLHGPPGCGKTFLANAIAGEMGVALLKVAAPELVAGVSGESEERIRELFERAVASSPCVLFIDEIDAITPNRQNVQKEMERRIVAQLLSCLDDLNQNKNGDQVLVIGATNRPDSIDPALRRAGRFDREISLGIPDVSSRLQILKKLTAKLKLADDFDYESIAKFTPGYVGADLVSLAREAAMVAVNRMFKDIQEQTKIKQQLEIQKNEEIAKLQLEAKIQPSVADANKSDPEIIVDDEVKEANVEKNVETQSNESDNPVLVIDDEGNKPISEKPASPVVTNGTKIDDEPTKIEEDISTSTSSEQQPILTPLQELLGLLHNKLPISEGELGTLCITMDDFGQAIKLVQPSAKREGFATVPDVTWDDVGSLKDIREELQMTILAPVRHSEQFKSLGINAPAGVLLCGPPGCGKTLLAKAIANEAGINFISVKGPELLNMYVGESERAVRTCFERARNSAPCVIFFDELDALCPKRSDSREGGATMRVVNQMLTEMDGIEGRSEVFLLAASNRPDIIDPAVLRPGRLDKILYVGLPKAADRVEILKTITKNGTRPVLAADVDLEEISEQCKGYTGADLAALVRESGVVALKEFILQGFSSQQIMVNKAHFDRAVAKIRPSVSEKEQTRYEKLRQLYSAVQEEVEEMELS